MGTDYITTIFHGFVLNEEDARKIEEKFKVPEHEENGFYNHIEELEKNDDVIEAISMGEGMEDDGYPARYKYGIAIRDSVFRTYLNESNEIHSIAGLTVSKEKEDWKNALKEYCKAQGLQDYASEWFINTGS